MLFIRPKTARSTVSSMSASSSTMNGSLPPSSMIVFLTFSPARSATRAPAASLPVNDTPCTRSSSMTAGMRRDDITRFV